MGLKTKTKCLIALILLGIVDAVIPVPILVVILYPVCAVSETAVVQGPCAGNLR